MKARFAITVNIDPEAWTANYGVEGAAAIREDVQRYLSNMVLETLASVGVLTEEGR